MAALCQKHVKKRGRGDTGCLFFTIECQCFFDLKNENVFKRAWDTYMAATIIDVARLCGYSKATVSRAYASPEAVSEKAREKIYAAAKQLNYAPNAIARAMVRQQTENIAFIIHEKQYPAILNPFYSPMLEAAMQEGTRRNYSLFVTTSQDIHLPSGDIYIKKHMDGVIFAGEVDIRVIEEFRKQSIPVVLVNNYLDMDGLVCISADHYGGAVQATEYLCKLGHCKIGLLSGRFSPQVSEARIEGFVKTLAKYDIPVDDRFIADIEPALEDGEEIMTRMLREVDRPTAFFCTNDTIAAGAMKAVTRAGLRVPEDIAIIGFDDSYISRVVEPELTTVRIDAAKMGCLAMQTLFDLIAGMPVEKAHIQIPTELIVRGTA